MKRLPGAAAALLTIALVGCGSTTVKTVTERETVAAAAATTTERHSVATTAERPARSAASSRPVGARAESGHPTVSGAWAACDSNIEAARPRTSCGFAQNTFYEYWTASGATSLRVYSPAAARWFTTDCSSSGFRITCHTADGGRVRFPSAAVDSYSSEQAARYAASHDVGSSTTDGSSASTPAPDPDESGDEIPNYDNGTGYRVQCADGMYSQSGGRPGACSGHGGVG